MPYSFICTVFLHKRGLKQYAGIFINTEAISRITKISMRCNQYAATGNEQIAWSTLCVLFILMKNVSMTSGLSLNAGIVSYNVILWWSHMCPWVLFADVQGAIVSLNHMVRSHVVAVCSFSRTQIVLTGCCQCYSSKTFCNPLLPSLTLQKQTLMGFDASLSTRSLINADFHRFGITESFIRWAACSFLTRGHGVVLTRDYRTGSH